MTSSRPLRWWRGLLAAWTVAHLVPRLPHLRELYCRPVLRDDVLEWLGVGPPPVTVVAALFGAALCGCALQLRRPTLGWWLVFPALLAIHALDPNSMRAYGLLATVQWGLLGVLLGAGVDPEAPEVPDWAPRLLVAQWASVYVLSVVAKLNEPAWWSGDALFLALNSDAYGRFLLSSGGVPHSVARALGYSAMALEVAVGVFALFPATRWLSVAGSLAFHGGVLLSMKISPLFATLMWLHLPLVATLPPLRRSAQPATAARTDVVAAKSPERT